ncbi:NADH:flavin oxidoreductase/NADH oxidase [Cloacibacterium sp.]|uniref:NADH:flavin oxidoreductase/NADH oxidase n=1 Tax=Cloacibacterium sp. TaxID=1913682 RepID=UPI0039E63AB2
MSTLFSPLQLRSLSLKNRIFLSPMQQYSALDGIPGKWHLVHLGSRAVGGAALILTECTAISPEAMCTPNDVGIWTEDQINAWKNITNFVHEQNAKIGVQLWHAGGKASTTHPNDGFTPLSIENGGWIPKSSSATPINYHQPKAMTLEDIKKVIEDFAQSAKNAVEAGFDTIELHAAHGYLLHQFYSALINKRTDEYGGSFENRIRLLIEVVDAIRTVIPSEMPLLLRLSAIDYSNSPDAWLLEDSIRLAPILKAHGVDFVTASGGGFVHVNPNIVKPSYQLPLATAIKETIEIPVGAVGMIIDAKQANEIIENGQADAVVIAREYLRNPYFALHAALELEENPNIPWQYKRGFN